MNKDIDISINKEDHGAYTYTGVGIHRIDRDIHVTINVNM